mmetsp:Transcript_146897/g.258933  ORF Transcript_146897/g.258933 Transcript_146897/m.258933 type:complete len:95 (+) Transcript_146897:464-748(+)
MVPAQENYDHTFHRMLCSLIACTLDSLCIHSDFCVPNQHSWSSSLDKVHTCYRMPCNVPPCSSGSHDIHFYLPKKNIQGVNLYTDHTDRKMPCT